MTREWKRVGFFRSVLVDERGQILASVEQRPGDLMGQGGEFVATIEAGHDMGTIGLYISEEAARAAVARELA